MRQRARSGCRGLKVNKEEEEVDLFRNGGEFQGLVVVVSSSLLLSSLELSDTQAYEPQIRALLGTASNFCEYEKQFRRGIVFEAHRLVYHSTLGLRVMKKKRRSSSPKFEPPLKSSGQPQPLDPKK